jgi:hypothetical protein
MTNPDEQDRNEMGDALRARATRASHRAEFHRLGLPAGIAIAGGRR